MLKRAILVWILGLVTIVPYGTYHLLFHATRDQYAWLITLVLFWIFGYWSVVGPLIAAVKVRRVFRTIEQARSREEFMTALQSAETQSAAIDFIATEHGIPRFLAARVYRLLVRKLPEVMAAPRPATPPKRG